MRGGDFYGSLVPYGVVVPFTPAASLVRRLFHFVRFRRYLHPHKLDRTWAVGGRIGYVALPGFLTYVNGGYTEAPLQHHRSARRHRPHDDPDFSGDRTYHGWFLGGGTEYAISRIPGLFWKSEYRFADYGSKDDFAVCGPGCAVGTNHALDRAHPHVPTITTELVYRFNTDLSRLKAPVSVGTFLLEFVTSYSAWVAPYMRGCTAHVRF